MSLKVSTGGDLEVPRNRRSRVHTGSGVERSRRNMPQYAAVCRNILQHFARPKSQWDIAPRATDTFAYEERNNCVHEKTPP